MAKTSSAPDRSLALDFKSATLYAVRVVLHSHDLAELLPALDQRMRDAGAFFENEPVVIDATKIDEPLDWQALAEALRGHRLFPIGVMAQDDNLASAQALGLTAVDLTSSAARVASKPAPEKETPAIAPPQNSGKAAAQKPAASAASAVAPAAMVINHPLRSGQRIYARQTDLVVIGAVNQGAEVIADGNIHIYGPLRGKAMAGARGDTSARIFTTQLDPELLAIAGVYRVIETRLEQPAHSHAMLVQLEGDALRIVPLDT
ncbi:MAG TPA: septum site-determining protein MinC [Burkholderiaceae bacterium]|nr:septum site-determining protein MinC [Burkholderiaceae bacterium]